MRAAQVFVQKEHTPPHFLFTRAKFSAPLASTILLRDCSQALHESFEPSCSARERS